ncbi:MAG: hypothetical protein WA970_26245, partial [Gammaproteobacteria bacterium]
MNALFTLFILTSLEGRTRLGTLLEADATLRHALSNHQNAQALGTLSGYLYEHLKNGSLVISVVYNYLITSKMSCTQRGPMRCVGTGALCSG